MIYLYDEPTQPQARHWAWMIALAALYALFTIAQWSTGYIDFGDGNYMYIASRIAQGSVVYRDILAPQPPCHLFLGALIYKLAVLARVEPLYFFRGFSLLLHLLTYALVIRLAWRAWQRPVTSVLAGAIYLWLPIGYWWSLGYQSEPLEIFFLLAMILLALRATFMGDVLAGVFAALAGLTNATAAPFLLVLIIYMAIRAPLRALRLTIACLLVVGPVVYFLEQWTGGAFLQNVVLNQVGTYPAESVAVFLNYAIGKLNSQGAKVLAIEGGFLFVALLGFWRFLRWSPLDSVTRGGLGWFFLASLGSIVYVTKGGTMDYIFTLSEPAIAVLAAEELMAWVERWNQPAVPEPGAPWMANGSRYILAKIVAFLLVLMFAFGPGLVFYRLLWMQQSYELSADKTDVVVQQIRMRSNPEEPILAPPFYAFLANRRIFNDYSELFIWQNKYVRDVMARDAQGEGYRMLSGIAAALREEKIPIALIEMDQTGRVPEIFKALQESYIPLPLRLNAPNLSHLGATLNTRLGMFVPINKTAPGEQAEQQQQEWAAFKADMIKNYGADAARWMYGLQ